MLLILQLTMAYGITFGLMNKVGFLHGKKKFLDDLLKCSYCTGFHSGYLVFMLSFPISNYSNALEAISMCVCLAFASSAFSYSADVFTQYLEANTKE